MYFKNLDFEVEPTEPLKHDKLERKYEIENLTSLILNLNTPAVLAINSPWGSGKTTFVKMWQQQLKESEAETLYFNAWETDFSQDPLVAFLGEMTSGLKELIGESKSSKHAWDHTVNLGKKILKYGVPAAIKISTAGVLDADKVLESELGKSLSSLASDSLNGYLEQKSDIVEFHDSLKKFIENSEKERIVIFVDELDRCRPNYAVELLERIKHLFNIEGITFVLSIDKAQLAHSINSVYGEKFESNGYLRRFIDFEYSLQKPKLEKFVKSLFSTLEIDKFCEPRQKYSELRNDLDSLSKSTIFFAENFNLSLRETEQIVAYTNVAIRTAKENEYIHPPLLVFLIALKYMDVVSYNKFISQTSFETEVLDFLMKSMPDQLKKDHFVAYLEGLILSVTYKKESESKRIQEHKKVLSRDEKTDEEEHYSSTVLNVFNRPSGFAQRISLELLAKRINWISEFEF
ncbi:P-loop NTPase fold protein [Aliiglaciecola sp. M165]|uniref:KAP family P-loop NTPase fold protein n=1 Tax=Aliiglaciecola sp. M165 TaxID=2593649 RepID=UPI00117E0EA2|nr:P-loop NTPase fold protein [Aliiglaciecola sp. M165]TRY30146.1 AAA family ATPase [Aliiglaciecola sp. M165]